MERKLVLLFDGRCALCNGAVDFVLRWDRNEKFLFAALQSPAGKRLRESAAIPEGVDSIVLLDGGRGWIRSAAVLRIARGLGLPWSPLWAFMVVPRVLRDALYDWIAAHRGEWFGSLGACRVPTAEERPRFVEH